MLLALKKIMMLLAICSSRAMPCLIHSVLLDSLWSIRTSQVKMQGSAQSLQGLVPCGEWIPSNGKRPKMSAWSSGSQSYLAKWHDYVIVNCTTNVKKMTREQSSREKETTRCCSVLCHEWCMHMWSNIIVWFPLSYCLVVLCNAWSRFLLFLLLLKTLVTCWQKRRKQNLVPSDQMIAARLLS